MKVKLWNVLPLGLFGWILLGAGSRAVTLPAAERQEAPRVDVILWFDTEDYLLPASDDAAKRLAEMLTERKVRATFKVVGEKARTLEQRGRRDVIAALKKHDIAYHTDFHSVHPTPSEYLADCGFLDGVAEFVRREGDGAGDVRRVFGVRTLGCYGQPGSSWAAQTMAGLKQIGVAPLGVPCYVDEGTHIGLDQKPFWYEGTLTVYHMGANYTRMDLHDPEAAEPARRRFSAIADRLVKEDGGGLISIFYHPCEWVHQQFWDGVNFARGQNPPREEWKQPPQRPAEETDGAFRRFGEYIDYIRSVPGVRFVTASELPSLYPDWLRRDGATKEDLEELVRRILNRSPEGVDFQVIGKKVYSLSDQFEFLTWALTQWIRGRALQFPVKIRGAFGPDHAPPEGGPKDRHLAWPAFREAALDAGDYVRAQLRVPSRVYIGARAVAPADFLVAMAAACQHHLRHGTFPEQDGVALGDATGVVPARHVAEDTPGLFGGWVIHEEGFRAPRILEIARLQTWTLKPALRWFGNEQ